MQVYDVTMMRVDEALSADIGPVPLLVVSPAGKGKLLFALVGDLGAYQSQIMSRNVASRLYPKLMALNALTRADLKGFTRV